MILDRNENKEVAVLLGAGSMGMAILRRVAAGKKILLGGRRQSSLDRAAESLRYSGYDVETFVVDAVDPVQVRAEAWPPSRYSLEKRYKAALPNEIRSTK